MGITACSSSSSDSTGIGIGDDSRGVSFCSFMGISSIVVCVPIGCSILDVISGGGGGGVCCCCSSGVSGGCIGW